LKEALVAASLTFRGPSNTYHLALILYLTSLFLLPWAWFPPFPWLHEHAQWSDAVFALTALLWAIERFQARQWPRLQPTHAALSLYFLLASLSALFAAPSFRAAAPKLIGVAELCTLALITSDLTSRPGVSPKIARAIVLTALLTAAAAIEGLVLFYARQPSNLIGIYGELEPSRWYARVQAGTYNPNLLASFCIFGAAVVARSEGKLSRWLRRVALGALWITVLLTFSRGILGFVLAAAIRNAHGTRRRRIAAAVAIVCLLLMVSATVWRPKVDPTHPLAIRLERVPSTRLQAATSSLGTLIVHPLLGSGLGTDPGSARGAPFEAHLTPLNIAATLGLPALITFSFLIASIWKKRRRPTDLAIWGGLAGLALDGLAQDTEDFRHLWVILGLAAVCSPDHETAASSSVPQRDRTR
jgi:hypothetical protein